MALRTSAGSGDWATAGTWDTGVPAATDTVLIQAAHVVTLDTDYSAITLGTITVNGTLTCAGTATAYLKTNADIVGTGTINCGASGTVLPNTRLMTFDFAATQYGFNSANLTLNLYCWNPTIARQFVVISGLEAAGQTVLEVGTNMTADWGAFDTAYFGVTGSHTQVHINDIGGTLPDAELRTIASINAGDITVSAGLSTQKVAGSQIVLLTRNIRLIGTNGTGSAVLACKSGSVLGCEMAAGASTAYGLGSSVGNGCILNGSIWGYNRGINMGSGHVNNGTISGNSYGFYYGSGHVNNGTISGNSYGNIYGAGLINNGTISGNNYSIIYGSGCVNNGTISGNNYGIHYGSGCVNNGTISGNTTGISRSMVYNYNAILDNTINIQESIVECFNTSMSGTTTQENTGYLLMPGSYSFSKDHDTTPGAFKAWSGGGIVVSETTTVPTGVTYSYKHTCETASYCNIRREEYRIDPGKILSITGYMKFADDHTAYAPKFSITDLGGGVLDTENAPTPAGSANWQTVTLSYSNTATYGVTVFVEFCCKRASGDVYEAFVIDSQDLPATSSVLDTDTVGGVAGTYSAEGGGGNTLAYMIFDTW